MAPKTTSVLAPTGELGAPGTVAEISGWINEWDATPELRWPNNVPILDQMRRDAHLAGGLRAITLPIRRTSWELDPDSVSECRPEVVDQVRQDLGIAEQGTRLRRPRGAIQFKDVLRHALLQLVFGHMVLERVYELDDAGRARLRKLAPRMQRTITGFQTDRTGQLTGIRQMVPRPNGQWETVDIPIERLVVFTFDKEGSDPTGNSLLRPAYGHWMFKQALMKVDAIAAERNGMGVPQFDYDPAEMTKQAALDVAKNVRAGESAGLAVPVGTADLKLKGVTGQVREIIPSIKYHDQEMGRLLLAMFLDLGQDNGARSLGETFVDFFVMALQSLADDIAETITEDAIRHLVEVNWGPDEPYPQLVCDEITGDTDLTADAMLALAKGGYIIPDHGLEAYLRTRYGFPQSTIPEDEPRPPVQSDPPPTDGAPPAEGDVIAKLEARFAALTAGPRAVGARVPSPS